MASTDLAPSRPRVNWETNTRANEILKRHYATAPPEVLAAMVAPLFPGCRITANMVIGRANRIGLKKERDPDV